MTARALISRLARFRRDEDGASLTEFGLVVPLFLLLAFGLIDFGRLGFSYVMAQKATERAVREAVVRTPVCTGVPEVNTRGPQVSSSFGGDCRSGNGICLDPGTVSCTAADGTTGTEIFAKIQPLLPTGATPQNLRFTYAFDPNLGFLGGPYIPVVTVEIDNLDFEFVTPIGALATLVQGNPERDVGASFRFPTMSTSLPGEVLLDGVSG